MEVKMMPNAGEIAPTSAFIEHDAAAQLAAIVQSSYDAIIGRDLDGTITSWNPGAERLYGYRSDEAIGQPASMLSSSDSYDTEATLLARVVAGEPVEMIPTRRTHKNGNTLQVSLSLSPIVDVHGLTVGISSASRDIGELLSAQGLYEGLLEAAPDAMVCVDSDGRIVLVNQQVQRLFGYAPDELVGQLVDILVPAALRAAHPGLRQVYLRDPTPRRMGGGSQLSGQRKDGSIFPADISISSIDLHGTMLVTAAIRDVSGRRDDDLALSQNESLVRQITESIDVSIVLRSLDPPKYLYMSAGYEKIFGDNPMAEGEDPADFLLRILPEDRERFRSEYWQPAQAGRAARCEYRMVRVNGDTRWIRSTSTPVTDGDGVIRRCAAVAEDITELKQNEAALRAADEARKANAAKNEFLSRMSHELRTPLNAVLGFAQLLEIDELTADQHTAVEHILLGGRHLVSLIDDVLDIAKIESDRLDLSLEAVLMSELLGDTVALMMPMATAANVRLSYHDGDGASQHVQGDSRRLRQVVLNLLSNAIKYNRPDGWVEVSCELSGSTGMNIVVRDSGLGIPAEELPRLFTPFDRLGAQSTAIEGSGVGLALSHRLMTTMGGSLSATSELGVGSVFTAAVPLATPATLPPVLPAPSQPTDADEPTTATDTPTMTLLYIEDNSSNITLMEHLIGHRPQWHMITAFDGTTGLDLATTRAPDLVLLDLHLPDMNGSEVLHRLRADPHTSDLRVVIVSADASPNQMNRLLAAGAYAYLTKPLDVARMLEVLDAFVPRPAESPT